MNTSKKINVNFSSLVGLKAELLRKQTEIKDTKAKEDAQPRVPKPKVRRKKIKDKKPKTEPDYTEIEDIGTLRKSKLMLEAKSMLYDQLKKTGGDDRHSYLVDFAQKRDSSSEDEFYREEDYEDTNLDPEDDWVEYRDCFGRTRTCLRRDLPKMREKDDVVKREITKEPEPEERREKTPEPPMVVPEKEPEIEIMRKKWEEQMERLADKSDIHYQDVLFDEARAHGVGYYGFSQNEEERAKQQENLAKLRKETEQRQKEMQEVKDLKSKMELNRLRAATIRQRVRAGLPAELTEEEEAALRAQINLRNSNETHTDADKDTNPEAIEAASKAAGKEPRVDNSLIVVEDKIKAFGELLGKRPKWNEMSQEEWVYKRRRDRLGEFAPVYENFRRSGSLRGTRDNQVTKRESDEEDPVRINVSCPEPTDRWETEAPVYRSKDIKREKREKTPRKTEDAAIKKENPAIVEDSEDSDDDKSEPPPPPVPANLPPPPVPANLPPLPVPANLPPPPPLPADLPPPPAPANPPPPSFINSFVLQPMTGESSLPVSFVRSVPPPPIMNFSVPPPSIIPPVAISSSFASKPSVVTVDDDSSDSDDSVIIGPVPPPSLSDFSSTPANNCGPRLINEGHFNMLSDIPLPTAVQFPVTRNHSNNASESPEGPESGRTTSNNLESIAAGLKYLRQKFENTHQ